MKAPVSRRLARIRAWLRGHPAAVTLAGTLVVGGALVVALWGKRDEFGTAFGSASLLVLGAAVLPR